MKNKFLIIIIVLGLIGLFWFSFSRPQKTNREVALACTSDMFTRFHIHPHLKIIINDQEVAVPAEIGITSGCMNAIHTHDTSGTIHIEAPERRDFLLSDFFAVWNKPFNKEQILDYKIDEQHLIKETVNGQEVRDFENTILRDEDQIIISYEKK